MGTSVRGFWIDQECIDQDNEAEKQRAVQSIEYVYSYSAFPVALLSVLFESEDQLKNLVYILRRSNPPRNEKRDRVRAVLSLSIISHLIHGWREAGHFKKTIARQQKCAFGSLTLPL